jgi:two-component system, OmpR family, phosphate regulon response regulator PhoB
MATSTTVEENLKMATDSLSLDVRKPAGDQPTMRSAQPDAAREILVVEDEAPIRAMIASGLNRAGFLAYEATDAQSALKQLAAQRPRLLLIDWMLPDFSGLELTRKLKLDRATRELPVIMLTARAEERHKIEGLGSGADDYVTKPFSFRELIARINAVLRRLEAKKSDAALRAEGLLLDPVSQRVFADSKRLHLRPKEYRLLEFFMTHPERVYLRHQIAEAIWGLRADVDERTIDANIRRLRVVLSAAKCDYLLQTVRGIGYRFSAQQTTMV